MYEDTGYKCYSFDLLSEPLPAWDGGLDDFLHDVTPQRLKRHLLGVLDRHNDGVYPGRHAGPIVEVIFAGDLRIYDKGSDMKYISFKMIVLVRT